MPLITVDIDLDELFYDVSDKDLLKELEARDLKVSRENKKEVTALEDLIDQALDALRRGDSEFAELILDRALHPKFASEAQSMQRYLSVCEHAGTR